MTVKAFWLPPECPVQLPTVERRYGRGARTITVEFPVVDAAAVAAAARQRAHVRHALRRAVELAPDDAAFQDRLAQVLAERRR